jgi:hypothetical protein
MSKLAAMLNAFEVRIRGKTNVDINHNAPLTIGCFVKQHHQQTYLYKQVPFKTTTITTTMDRTTTTTTAKTTTTRTKDDKRQQRQRQQTMVNVVATLSTATTTTAPAGATTW